MDLGQLPGGQADDISCRQCGYQLRDLPTDSVCPECGALILISLQVRPGTIGDPLSFDDVKRIRRCLQFILVSILYFSIHRLAWYAYYVSINLYSDFATWMDSNTWLWLILYHGYLVDILLLGAGVIFTFRSSMRRKQAVLYASGLGLVLFGVIDQWIVFLYNRYVAFLGAVGPPWTPIRVLYFLTPLHHIGLAILLLCMGRRLRRSGFVSHQKWCKIALMMCIIFFIGNALWEWSFFTEKIFSNRIIWDSNTIFRGYVEPAAKLVLLCVIFFTYCDVIELEYQDLRLISFSPEQESR